MLLFHIFLYICLISASYSYDIYISNIAQSNQVPNASLIPFSSIYSAFLSIQNITIYPNISISDEFHFKIVPSDIPYTLNDSEVANQVFNGFIGHIFIESTSPNLSPIIEWQTTSFAFKISTSFSMSNIIIDGNNVHIKNKTQCSTTNLCCNTSDYLNKSSICLLKSQSFSRNSWVNAFEGIFILNGSKCQFSLINVSITNFYAVLNYNALIFDINQTSSISITSLSMSNVFFVKGIFTLDGGNQSNGFKPSPDFTFNLKNLYVERWNYYQVVFSFGFNIIFAPNGQSNTLIFGFCNVINVYFSNITFSQINVGYIMMYEYAIVFINAFKVDTIVGSVFFSTYSQMINISDFYVNNGVYAGPITFSYPLISDSYLSTIIITNAIFSNIYGTCIYLERITLRMKNIVVYNITCASTLNFQGMVVHVGVGSFGNASDVILEKMNISRISKANNILVGEVSYPNKYFLIKDSIFENIDFLKGALVFVFMYFNSTVENVIFSNITLSQSIFYASFYKNMYPVFSYLTVNSCHILSITTLGVFGPINKMSYNATQINFMNTIIDTITNGVYTFYISFSGLQIYYFQNTTFKNFYYSSGFLLSVQPTDSGTFINCTFDSFSYSSPATSRGLIESVNSTVVMESCIIKNIKFYLDNGWVFSVQMTLLTINNTVFQDIYIEGKGGITADLFSNLTLNNSILQNIRNLDSGFISLTNATIVTARNTLFSNISSFQYTVFFIHDLYNLTVSFCTFINIKASLENAIFFIWSSKTFYNYDKNSQISFENNDFQKNYAISANGAGLIFQNCHIPISLVNNTFSEGFANEGGFILAVTGGDLYVTHCVFKNAYAGANGAALMVKYLNSLQISDCNFSANAVNYGKGASIFLMDTIFFIENSIFEGDTNRSILSQSMIASAIYAFFSSAFITFGVHHCKFNNLLQDSNVILIESFNKIQIILEDLNFTEITSKNGNGVFSCDQCYGNIQQIQITNSIILSQGVMLKISRVDGSDNSNSLYNLTIQKLNFGNNTLNENGYLIYLENVKFIDFSDCLIENNLLKNTLFDIKSFLNLSIISLISINNSIIRDIANAGYFGQLTNGMNLYIIASIFQNTMSSYFWISSVNQLLIENITFNNQNNTNQDYFSLIENVDFIKILKMTITQSNLNGINIFVKDFIGESMKFSDIIRKDGSSLLYLSSLDGNGNITLKDIEIRNTLSGFTMSNLWEVEINEYIFDNSKYTFLSYSSLIFMSVFNISVLNSSINYVTYGPGINVLKLQSNVKGLINLVNTSISYCGSDLTAGGVNIQGSYDISLTQCNFNSNKGVPGSAVSFNSKPDPNISVLTFVQCAFLSSQLASIIVPNDTFYSYFKDNQKNLLQNPNLTIKSFAYKLQIYSINDTKELLYNEGDINFIYSGETIDFRFQAFDHFNEITDSLDSMLLQLQLNYSSEKYSLQKYKTLFIKSNASLLSFSIMCESSQISNEQIKLSVLITDQNQNKTLSSFSTFPIIFQIIPCDIGHIIIDNICTVCPIGSYSLEPTPSNYTQCKTCPDNAQCLEGKIIAPNEGFWNLNENDPNIFQCENKEACKNQCQAGFFGNICNECQKEFSKTIMPNCKPCKETIKLEILQKISKWIILAFLTSYQTYLLQNYKENKSNRILFSLINIFIYHSNIVALSANFHSEFSQDLENFYEVQSIVTYLENDLYVLYCTFPQTRDFMFYYILFLYILAIPVFQLFFLSIGYVIKYIIQRKNYKDEINTAFCLLFFNNFISLFYYFLGLVFYVKINDKNKVSSSFMEMGLSTSEFGVLLAVLFVGNFPFFIVPSIYFIKKNIFYGKIHILDCESKKKFQKILIIHFVCLFFTLILNHYSSINFGFAFFARNLFMIYLVIVVGFRPYSSEFIFWLKILSLIVLIVSFSENFKAIIVLNSLFYVGLIVGIVAKLCLKKKDDRTLVNI